MSAPVSSAEQYWHRRADFISVHVRPCECDGDGPLDLREERTGRFECATCARRWRLRVEVTS